MFRLYFFLTVTLAPLLLAFQTLCTKALVFSKVRYIA